jgi:hypothetical protein
MMTSKEVSAMLLARFHRGDDQRSITVIARSPCDEAIHLCR